jgi:cobalt-zinc-cadmium efflux system outer membrane protein
VEVYPASRVPVHLPGDTAVLPSLLGFRLRSTFPTSSVRIACAALGALALAAPSAAPLGAQRLVSRADAVRAALDGGSRLALARSDSAAARARLAGARALPNPSLAASYSKSAPQKHVALEIPFDAPWSRGPRVRAASALARAAWLRLLSERTAVEVEADTTYTQALAAAARYRLSRQTARDADSLRAMATARRDAGDASDLDVDLATVTAGQQWNVASADSLAYMSTVLTLQTLMGLPPDSATIVLSDSLRLDASEMPPLGTRDESVGVVAGVALLPATPPSVAAAEASYRAAELALTRERRSVLGLPALSVGAEFGDPAGDEPGVLPVVGIVLPLPLFNRNQGPIAEAAAERDRARAELAAARLEARQRLVEGTVERRALRARVVRDSALVVAAQRVAARSLTAYREGAAALPSVLEARRSAREVLGQYIDDVAALLIVNAELRALTQTVPTAP